MIEIVPSENDVLCGRGGATNNHPGNRNFRRLVADRQAVYLEAKKRDKADIARSIVRIIRESGGRFLKKADESGDRWIDVGDKKATEKTSQALREGLEVRASVPAVGGGGVTSSGRKRRSEGSDDSSDGESREGASGSASKRRRSGEDKPSSSPSPMVSAEGFVPPSSGVVSSGAAVGSESVDSKTTPSAGSTEGSSEALHFEAPPVSASDCSNVVEV